MPDSRNVRRSQLPICGQTKAAESKNQKTTRQIKIRDGCETISVGGKTFNRENNVGYDSAYRGRMRPFNVTRGTNEYKKLDSGLRGIAENLAAQSSSFGSKRHIEFSKISLLKQYIVLIETFYNLEASHESAKNLASIHFFIG